MRVCEICKKRLRRAPDGSNETTLGFHTTLASLGIPGDKAHPSCVREAVEQKQSSEVKRKE